MPGPLPRSDAATGTYLVWLGRRGSGRGAIAAMAGGAWLDWTSRTICWPTACSPGRELVASQQICGDAETRLRLRLWDDWRAAQGLTLNMLHPGGTGRSAWPAWDRSRRCRVWHYGCGPATESAPASRAWWGCSSTRCRCAWNLPPDQKLAFPDWRDCRRASQRPDGASGHAV